MLITLEGIDGSGKTTLAQSLTDNLLREGQETRLINKHLHRPIRFAYSELCRNGRDFPSPLSSLFLALSDFAWTVDRYATDFSGVTLWDRYIYSALADALSLGLPPSLLDQACPAFPQSDLTLLVAVPAQVARMRRNCISLPEAGGPEFIARYGTPERAFEAFQEGVNEGYLFLRNSEKLGQRVIVLDGTRPTRELHEMAMEALSLLFLTSRSQ